MSAASPLSGWADWNWLLPLVAAPFIGSYLGPLIHRLPAGTAALPARPTCARCGSRLAFRDLIPVVSWLLRGGRCRHCAAPNGIFYPAVELAALGVALWAAAVVSGWLLWASCILGWALLTLAVIDHRHMILPDVLTLPLIPAGLVVAYLAHPPLLTGHAIGAAAGFVVFTAMGALYRWIRGREGLGLGDAKLLAAAGAWVSWTGLPSVVLLASVATLVTVLVMSFAGRPVSLVDKVTFGPFLGLATWLVWLYGPISFA